MIRYFVYYFLSNFLIFQILLFLGFENNSTVFQSNMKIFFTVLEIHYFFCSFKIPLCRGRLVQRETIRLRIQRSKFDSRIRLRQNRWMFLSRRGNKLCRTLIHFKSLFSGKRKHNKSSNAIYWKQKQSSSLSLYEKGAVP